jgi:regulator of sigma E protease
MTSIIIFILILSVLVIIHEFGHFIAAKKHNVYVEEFGIGLPPRIFGKKIGETIYSINLLPFGGFVKVLGEEEHELSEKIIDPALAKRTFVNKNPFQKISIIIMGVIFNFILGWVILSFLFTQGVPSISKFTRIEKILASSPAERVDLHINDIILKVSYNNNFFTITNPDDLIYLSKRYAGKPIKLYIQRSGTSIVKNIVPRKNPPKDQGTLGIGITNIELKKYSALQAPYYGLLETVNITYVTMRELSTMLFKFVTFQKQKVEVAGPVGIYVITKEAAKYGYIAILQLMALLSINLAIINIFPFPALDGGRLAMILYELLSKRKVNPLVEKKLNLIGIIILISLIILITIHDFVKLIKW